MYKKETNDKKRLLWGDCVPCICSTVHGREVQPLAALKPTVSLSPWREVWKNIHSRVGIPGPRPDLYSPQEGTPLLIPLVPVTMGYGPHPQETGLDHSVQGGYPQYHLFSTEEGTPLLVPCIPSFSASLPPTFAHNLLAVLYFIR